MVKMKDSKMLRWSLARPCILFLFVGSLTVSACGYENTFETQVSGIRADLVARDADILAGLKAGVSTKSAGCICVSDLSSSI